MDKIQRNDPEFTRIPGQDDAFWLRRIETNREWIAAEEKRLEWAKHQLPGVLSECVLLLKGAPTSCREMELRSELEAKEVFNALVGLHGRPSRPIRPVIDNQGRNPTDRLSHTLSHWQGECRQFEEELKEWKKFIESRRKETPDGTTEVQLEGHPAKATR